MIPSWRNNITKQNDQDDRTIIDRIEAMEATLTEMGQHVNSLAIDVSYLKPSFTEPTLVSENETESSNAKRNTEAALKILDEVGIPHSSNGWEVAAAVKRAASIAQIKKGRDHNRFANCRIPVKSQIAAWFVANCQITGRYEFENVDILDQLIAISDLSPAPVNWSLRANDALALRWMDMAWDRAPKTTVLPF